MLPPLTQAAEYRVVPVFLAHPISVSVILTSRQPSPKLRLTREAGGRVGTASILFPPETTKGS